MDTSNKLVHAIACRSRVKRSVTKTFCEGIMMRPIDNRTCIKAYIVLLLGLGVINVVTRLPFIMGMGFVQTFSLDWGNIISLLASLALGFFVFRIVVRQYLNGKENHQQKETQNQKVDHSSKGSNTSL